MSAPGRGAANQPPAAPTPGEMRARETADAVEKASTQAVNESAAKWSAGLGAFLTLITSALLVKGPESANDLTYHDRIVLTVLFGAGVALGLLALWSALLAAAGVPESVPREQFELLYPTEAAPDAARARKTVRRLTWSRRTMAGSLVLLLGGIGFWWWSPPAPPDPPAMLSVDTGGAKPVCGTLISADGQAFVLQERGKSGKTTVAFASVQNVSVVASC